jgi:hypothetical protein
MKSLLLEEVTQAAKGDGREYHMVLQWGVTNAIIHLQHQSQPANLSVIISSILLFLQNKSDFL